MGDKIDIKELYKKGLATHAYSLMEYLRKNYQTEEYFYPALCRPFLSMLDKYCRISDKTNPADIISGNGYLKDKDIVENSKEPDDARKAFSIMNRAKKWIFANNQQNNATDYLLQKEKLRTQAYEMGKRPAEPFKNKVNGLKEMEIRALRQI